MINCLSLFIFSFFLSFCIYCQTLFRVLSAGVLCTLRVILQDLSPRNGYVLAAKEIRVGHDKLSMVILQVLSPRNGYVLAAKEIRVGHDKLSIKRLSLKLITDLQLYVMASDQVEGALVATAVEHDQLLSKYQVSHKMRSRV